MAGGHYAGQWGLGVLVRPGIDSELTPLDGRLSPRTGVAWGAQEWGFRPRLVGGKTGTPSGNNGLDGGRAAARFHRGAAVSASAVGCPLGQRRAQRVRGFRSRSLRDRVARRPWPGDALTRNDGWQPPTEDHFWVAGRAGGAPNAMGCLRQRGCIRHVAGLIRPRPGDEQGGGAECGASYGPRLPGAWERPERGAGLDRR